YHLRAQILVPTGQVAAGVASLLMIPYPTGDCSGPPPPSLGPILETPPVGELGRWVDSAVSFDAFTHSGKVLVALRPTTGGHSEANFDDVELAEGALACAAGPHTLCLL